MTDEYELHSQRDLSFIVPFGPLKEMQLEGDANWYEDQLMAYFVRYLFDDNENRLSRLPRELQHDLAETVSFPFLTYMNDPRQYMQFSRAVTRWFIDRAEDMKKDIYSFFIKRDADGYPVIYGLRLISTGS